jgi:hypothetical protein
LESSVAGGWSRHASAILGDSASREARVGSDIDYIERKMWNDVYDVTNVKF